MITQAAWSSVAPRLPCNRGQRDVDDRGVDRFHQRGKHDAEDDDPAAETVLDGIAARFHGPMIGPRGAGGRTKHGSPGPDLDYRRILLRSRDTFALPGGMRSMDWNDGRVVVLAPDAVADRDGDRRLARCARQGRHGSDRRPRLVPVSCARRGHVSRSTAAAAFSGRTRSSPRRPARFACSLSDDRELYVITVRDRSVTPDDQRGFIPFFERQFSVADGRRWLDRMTDLADRAAAGPLLSTPTSRRSRTPRCRIFGSANPAARTKRYARCSILSGIISPRRSRSSSSRPARATPRTTSTISRALHTGRALGRWITDMRMARARAALEQTDVPVAEVGAAVRLR